MVISTGSTTKVYDVVKRLIRVMGWGGMGEVVVGAKVGEGGSDGQEFSG